MSRMCIFTTINTEIPLLLRSIGYTNQFSVNYEQRGCTRGKEPEGLPKGTEGKNLYNSINFKKKFSEY